MWPSATAQVVGEESIRGIDKTKLEHEFGRNKSWQSFRAQPHDQTRPDQFTYYIISNYYCYSVLNERRRSWNTKENNTNFVIAGGGVNILRMQSLARDLLRFLSMFLIYFLLAPLAIGEMKRWENERESCQIIMFNSTDGWVCHGKCHKKHIIRLCLYFALVLCACPCGLVSWLLCDIPRANLALWRHCTVTDRKRSRTGSQACFKATVEKQRTTGIKSETYDWVCVYLGRYFAPQLAVPSSVWMLNRNIIIQYNVAKRD